MNEWPYVGLVGNRWIVWTEDRMFPPEVMNGSAAKQYGQIGSFADEQTARWFANKHRARRQRLYEKNGLSCTI